MNEVIRPAMDGASCMSAWLAMLALLVILSVDEATVRREAESC